MLILAIDSATPVAGAALLDGEHLLYEQYIDYKKTHSETMMLMIDQALKSCEKRIEDLECIAISAGPGSFTGLRIGMAAAKGLSLSANIPIAAVSTLQALALNAGIQDGLVCPVLDARKNEVYAGIYEIIGGHPELRGEERAVGTGGLVAWINDTLQESGQQRICCLGSGWRHCAESVQQQFAGLISTVSAHLMFPRASAVGILAGRRMQKGSGDDVYSLEPVYIRKSEAEYRLEAKAAGLC